MRSTLLGAAIALLGVIVGPRPLAAQFAQPPWGIQEQPAQTAPAETTVPAAHVARRARKAKKVNTPNAAKSAIPPINLVRKEQHAPRLLPNLRKIAQKEGYKRVSDLVNFPKFFPGLGVIFVKPDTLPSGPYICFDRRDRLIATVFMVSIKDIDDHKSYEARAPAFAGKVDHVAHYFNSGHPRGDWRRLINHMFQRRRKRGLRNDAPKRQSGPSSVMGIQNVAEYR
jgi:hypothetical protein